MFKGLIVNADGFGFTAGVNRGIIETIEKGIVRSTSALANMPSIDEVADLAKRFPDISIGIHLNLTVGRPVSPPDEVGSLVNEEGEFLGAAFVGRLLSGGIRMSEMILELDRQVERLLEFGVKPTHFDGQENKHLYPPFFIAAIKVAKKRGISMMRSHNRYLFIRTSRRGINVARYYLSHPRSLGTHSFARLLMLFAHLQGLRTADRLITPGYADESSKVSLRSWIGIIENLPNGINEIYCHPGYVDGRLADYTYYVKEREIEVSVLTSPELKKALARDGVQLMSFKDLQNI